MPQVRTSYDMDEDGSVIYQTDEYGGSHNDIDDTERFTDDIDLTKHTGAVVDFLFEPIGADTTDDIVFTLYKQGGSSWSGSEIAWKSAITKTNNGSERLYSYTIPEGYEAGHYRFGIKSNGSTTSFDIQVTAYRWRRTVTRA